MIRVLKFLFGGWRFNLENKLNNFVLIIRNKTLKIGKQVIIKNTKLAQFNYLADHVILLNSILGKYSYLSPNAKVNNAEIGAFTCIGPNVLIGLGKHPTSSFVSIHPVFYSTAKQVGTTFVKDNLFDEFPDPTSIGNDVWIGANVIIVGGVTIGDGAIIASGSVVTKDVESFAIIGGIPAKKISQRFDRDEIEQLKKLMWWQWPESTLRDTASLFGSIEEFLGRFE